MLSGLNLKPIINADVGSLVTFWNAGVSAFRTNVTVAVESGMTGESLFTVYHAQEPLLRHLYFEATAFARKGWQAQHVFGRRDELTSAEEFAVSRFRTDVLNKERRTMNDYLAVISVDGNFDRFTNYAKTTYRLFPSMSMILRSIAERYSLDASERRIVIKSVVDTVKQFANPEIHLKARNAFDNIIELCVVQSRDGGQISISGEYPTIHFKYEGGGGSLGQIYTALRNIWESEAALNWEVRVEETPHGATVLSVTMPDENFATPGMVGMRKKTTQRLKFIGDGHRRNLLEMAKIFIGVQPYHGYRLVRGGNIDVSMSPIYEAVVASGKLVAPIIRSMTRSSVIK